MTETELSVQKIIKVAGVLGMSLAINYLINNHLLSPKQKKHNQQKIQPKNPIQQKKFHRFHEYQAWGQKKFSKQQEFNSNWGTLKILDFDEEDGLLQQLTYQTKALCDLERVNNLIVDLQLSQIKTIPCPLIAHKKKHIQSQPFLQKEAVVNPGQFLIKNCVFKSGQTIQNEKKFMRAGPRNTQFFNPKEVRADIVCLGKLCPGINAIIRQLVFMLKNVYKVDKVFGVKSSFDGYYSYEKDPQNQTIIQLSPDMLQTIHHRGGCYLGICKTDFRPKQIVDNLVKRGVNQVYLIGAYNTFISAHQIYQEIKKRKLAIGICVLLKAINKDVAIFDTCFGFESAVEQSQRYIEQAYVNAKSYKNTVSLIKVPGKYSGFLAADATRAARNVNICLVPQFPYDFNGQSGLLKYISQRIKHKGNCIIVYSQGACTSARDIDMGDKQNWQQAIHYFDQLLKSSIVNQLTKQNLVPNSVMMFESTEQVRSIPANSLDTKLCCQVAHSSIYGLMAGYTNFVCGHLGSRNAMVPITQMMTRQNLYCLKPEHEAWQRTLATTGQPSFINL